MSSSNGAGKSPALEVVGLKRHFEDRGDLVRAVNGVSFTVEPGTVYTLLGPSGCGKTTTLRSVAGLEHADAGRIVIGGEVVSDSASGKFVGPHRRDLGMVFQSYGIWPHMTVFDNAAFPLRLIKPKLTPTEIKQRVEEALAVVQLAGYEGRPAPQLSGGQQQRLALARALVRRPKLLLLDEPLSNLDATLRETMRAELSSLQARLGLTMLYVTHDQGEALSMSARVAVMRDGLIEQEASPEDLYRRPATRFVAEFVGTTNFVEATVTTARSGNVSLKTASGQSLYTSSKGARSGDSVTVSIRPEAMTLEPKAPRAKSNVLEGTLEQVMFLGETIEYSFRTADGLFKGRQAPGWTPKAGDKAWLSLDGDAMALLSDSEAPAASDAGLVTSLTALPDSMLAARAYDGAEELKLEQIPVPVPAEGEVLVKVFASGVVRGMLTLWKTGRIPELPATLGPAMAGEIAATGDGVVGWSPGERVRVHPNLSCRNCDYCRSDREMMCSAHSIMGHSSFGPDAHTLFSRYHNGGLAQYVLAPESNIDPLPESVSFRAGAKIRDVATAFGSLDLADVPIGGTLAITAATGSQGVSAVRLAPFFGIARVIAVGRTNDRLADVKALNPDLVETLALEDLEGWEESGLLTETLREMTGGGPAGLYDLTPPQGGAVGWHAVRSLRRGGTAVVVGGSLSPPDMSAQEMMINCTRIVGARNCGREGQRAITNLIATGQLEIDDLATHHFALEDINDAVRAVENRAEKMWMVGVDVAE